MTSFTAFLPTEDSSGRLAISRSANCEACRPALQQETERPDGHWLRASKSRRGGMIAEARERIEPGDLVTFLPLDGLCG